MFAVPATRAARSVIAPHEPPHFIETRLRVFWPLDDGSAVAVTANVGLELATLRLADAVANAASLAMSSILDKTLGSKESLPTIVRG
jgi:hypothetical protein